MFPIIMMAKEILSSRKTTVIFIISVLVFILSAFSYSNSTNALEQLTGEYRNGLQNVETALFELKNTAEAPTFDLVKTRQAFLNVRGKYKQIEFILEYFDNTAVKDYVNGAPLPKIERNSGEMNVLQPHGLQVIDEMLFEEQPDTEGLKNEIALLCKNFTELKLFQQKQYMSERNLFEAARLQLVRVASMGITGFDTPGSGNSLADCQNALQPLLYMAKVYTPQLKGELGQQLETKLSAAIQYLSVNADFDAFNRLEFIREYLNPAFKLFKDAQLQLGIETVYDTPAGINQPYNYLADNFFGNDFLNPDYYSMVKKGITQPQMEKLGKYLFFDPVLSSNNKRACASCHNPQKAFTDGEQRSLALDFKGTVSRNSPTLINSVFAERYFYDLRTEKIENQFEHVITSPHEFNTSYPEISAKLNQSEEYKQLFREAFPNYNGEISKHTISEAIGAYLKTLTSFNSDFDKHLRGEANILSPQAINGFNLFMGKAACATCHFAPTFSGLVPPNFAENESEVLGVPATNDTINPVLDGDIGRFGGRMKEKVDFNRHAFKTVTVRNAALTAPYMHNGVYKTLEDVLDFYNRGGGAGLGFELDNQTLAPDALNLTPSETKDIIAFMQSLTDTTGLTQVPVSLPKFPSADLNKRKIGGEY
ncbi:MAG: cytochrome-c peroxidase [Bacteroidetes bacterium]|nr:MAG: cytochrome-c peroxidase [Bacteroidota bacterium]